MTTEPIRAAQAQFAQVARAALAAGEQWRETQAAAGLRLLHMQLGHLDAGRAAPALRDLADLQWRFAAGLVSQAQALHTALETQARGGIGDLRAAQTPDEVAIVCAGLFAAAGTTMRAAAEEAMTLLNATRAGAAVLVHRGLDELSDAAGAP